MKLNSYFFRFLGTTEAALSQVFMILDEAGCPYACLAKDCRIQFSNLIERLMKDICSSESVCQSSEDKKS